MATSYNGYEVIANYGDSRLAKLAANGHLFAPNPGILGGPVATVMNYLADFLDREVEPIDLTQQLDDWAFQPKEVTGGSGWSCHASATAFDYNALNHPQGADNTWTSAQKSKVDAFLANVLEGSVRWGEHYTYPTKRDGMHYEVMAPINVMIRIADKVTGLKTITGDDMSPQDVAAINAHTDAKLKAMDDKLNHLMTFVDGNKLQTGAYDQNGQANRAKLTLTKLDQILNKK